MWLVTSKFEAMKKTSTIFFLLTGMILLFSGCASTGLTASSHLTNVELSNPNFRLVAMNVSGEASSRAVFGISYGFGMAASQMALIPLDEDRMLYKTVMEKLWEGFEDTHGAVRGRRLALVNMRYDSETINLFFYTKVTTVVIADVVEFE